MFRAVIFDLDDTLSDWPASIARALDKLEPHVPEPHRAKIRGRLQAAIEDQAFVRRDGMIVNRHHWMLLVDPRPFWRAALPGVEDGTAESLAQRFRSLLEPICFDDARPSVDALHGAYRLGVLSNSPRSEEALARLGLRQYFDAVIVAEEPERKPHARAFLRACEALGVAPREAVYVGDSLASDIEGAVAAGLIAVWLDRHGERYPLPDGAHRIASLRELAGLLDVVGRS